MHPTRILVLVVLAALLAGCGSTGLPLQVHWVRNSAEYRAAVQATYLLAGERLAEVADGHAPGTWAVALDADETVISNSQFEKEMSEKGLTYSPAAWKAWVQREAATALPGAKEFLVKVQEMGGKVAIVTNRDHDVCEETAANFRARELPFDVMLCKKDDKRKEPRWQQVEDGKAAEGLGPLKILMWLGDNIQDFPQGNQDERFKPVKPEYGRTFFVLPNPMYGSWTDNPKD